MKFRFPPLLTLLAGVLTTLAWASIAFRGIATRDPVLLRQAGLESLRYLVPFWLVSAACYFYVSRQPGIVLRVFGWLGLVCTCIMFAQMLGLILP